MEGNDALGTSPADVRTARVLIVDDHAAVRAGLVTLLESEPDLQVLPPVSGATEALRQAQEMPPDVALLDVRLQDGDGLRLCLRLKQLDPPPGVLLYTADDDSGISLKAWLAGADDVVVKSAPARELTARLRRVSERAARPPRPPRGVVEDAAVRWSPEDLAIVGLRLDRTSIPDIAEVLGVSDAEVMERIERML